MKISLSQLITAAMPVSEVLEQAKLNNYDEVELALRAGDNEPFNYNVSDSELDSWREQAASLGLPISSMAMNMKSGNLLAAGSEGAAGLASTERGLELCAKLGAKVCLHTLGSLNPELYYEDAYNNAVAALQKLVPCLEKLDLRLAIEFIWNGFLFSPLEMRRFIDQVGSQRVGFYFDPGNMAVFQFPQHWVRALGKRIFHVHLKDWKGRALNGEWTALLQGEVNFPVVMRELRQAGYQGPLVSEVSPSLASLEDTAAAMRKIAAM
ncbi:MAG: sugar phosphate isomerase/epimerase [Lentisphaeria bacterium]|nr:sugar phosphate isomerase/epimerase [Lentisphaeria bacterium]MDY0176854.1 sugar phosphate isomerase/epimerase family protein [Lentisphaeria bacterium]